MSVDEVRDWLRERGADRIDHPGGSLYAHLCRVRERLAALGCDADVQLAGLTHAVYGTDGFDVALLDRTGRATLRDLVGDEAADLVYRYGACDRRRTWRGLATTVAVYDRFTGQVTTLRGEHLRSFVDLSVVNELDVVEQDPSVLDTHGAFFHDLFAAWAPAMSPPVASEVTRVFGSRRSGAAGQ
ncbi:hypothetical protein GKC29_18260 [Micromonospora sp. WMMC415]|uniref:DUF6817 domain-containing protein n=1 Tax=Micromonospora sp. WMMC415 TaxID=2675222 RepID=UPI0012B4FD35|nr:hypothetical protein [Micromonospora sp. WMMC415]QGN48583.1 hypothetical protein GKC29_18260 [Micromonospora sp. WMMC415]